MADEEELEGVGDKPLNESEIPEELRPLYQVSHELALAFATNDRSTFHYVAEVIFHVSGDASPFSNDDIRKLARDYFVDALIKCNLGHLPYDHSIWRAILSTQRHEGNICF